MRINPWKLTTFALLGGLATTTIVGPVLADRQPHMRTALVAMKKAQVQLERATADKGGHRAKAIVLMKQAIDEVELGIKFDNQH